jgi:hypothetical protein
MIDPLSDFGSNSIWSLTTLVVADGVYPVMGYSTLVDNIFEVLQKVLQLEATQILDVCCYSLVVIVVVLATYLPLPCSSQTECRPSY